MASYKKLPGKAPLITLPGSSDSGSTLQTVRQIAAKTDPTGTASSDNVAEVSTASMPNWP